MKKSNAIPKWVLGSFVQLLGGAVAWGIWVFVRVLFVVVGDKKIDLYQNVGAVFLLAPLIIYLIWYSIYNTDSKRNMEHVRNAQGEWLFTVLSFFISGGAALLLAFAFCGDRVLQLSVILGAAFCALVVAAVNMLCMKKFAPWM